MHCDGQAGGAVVGAGCHDRRQLIAPGRQRHIGLALIAGHGADQEGAVEQQLGRCATG